MKPFYMLLLFYASVRENVPLVTEARETVKELSNDDYRVLGFGEHMCAIGFTTEQPIEAINADLKPIHGEKLHALVIEVASIVGGSMYEPAWQWLVRYMWAAKK
jgi:hypothetical protein